MPSNNFPGKFILLTRGEVGQSGYMEISIVNKANKKHFRTTITSSNRTETID